MGAYSGLYFAECQAGMPGNHFRDKYMELLHYQAYWPDIFIFAGGPLGQRANMECQDAMTGNHTVAMFKLFITLSFMGAYSGLYFAAT